MAFAFDTLGYARRLRDGGIPAQAAEVHAELQRRLDARHNSPPTPSKAKSKVT